MENTNRRSSLVKREAYSGNDQLQARYASRDTLHGWITLFFIAVSFNSCAFIKTNKVCFDKHCFRVDIAATEKEMSRGLQFRRHLPADRGMLFVFPRETKLGFWMKDTLIPLDIIWMDKDRRVIHIANNLSPCRQASCPTYTPTQNALYVLEINAFQTSRLNIQIGDRAEFKLDQDLRGR